MGSGNVVAVLGSVCTALLGLLIYAARRIFSGDLIARKAMEDLKQNYEAQLEREKEISVSWRDAHQRLLESVTALTQQGNRMLEGQRTIEAFVLAMAHIPQDASSRLGGSSE